MADNKAAFGVFPQMKPKRSKQDREAAKNVPVDLARGFVAGTLGLPGDLEGLARLLMNIQGPEKFVMPRSKDEAMAMLGQIFGADRVDLETKLPTTEDIEKRLPFKSDSPVSRAATGLGQIGGGFYTGPLSGARAATAIPKAVVRAGKDFVQAAGQSVSPLTVYHGSPHKFKKFDSSKIGTGEGAQAYGHGLYFAETPDVAKTYQPRSPKFEEKLIGLYQKAQSSSNYPMMEVLEDAMLHRTPNEIIQKFSNVDNGYSSQHAKAAQDFAKWYSKNEPEVGGLYTVDLPDEKIARMLDYDKPINEQAPEVIELLRNAGINTESSAKAGTMIGGQEMHLAKHGIPGIKYLDEASRGASGAGKWKITMKNGEQKIYDFKPNDDVLEQMGATAEPTGTRNFVVFPGEEDALTILDRKKEGGSVSMSDNPDAQMMEVMDKKLAGGGLLKGLKTAAKAARGTQDVLPAAEREANLQRMLAESKTPMRLYHGTTASEGGKGQEAIRRLKPSKEGALGSGVYLTPNSKFASSYAEEAGGNMLPVYAQLKNPLILRGSGVPDKYKDPMIEALEILGMDSAQAAKMVERAYENKGYIGKEVESRARAAGYDGLIQYERNGDISEVVSYNPNAIKSAVGNKGTYDTTKPELNEAGGGLIKGLKAAVKKEPPAVNRLDMNYKDVTKRVPELTDAAKKIPLGEVTSEEYAKLVNKFKPVKPYEFVPQPATAEDATRALTANKKAMFGKTKEIPAGQPTDLRLDIPAYKDHGVWVNSVHRKGEPTAYGSVSSVKNATMFGAPDKALRVATGEAAKGPWAVISGDWNPMDEAAAVKSAQEYLNHKDWRQVGYDPERHGYFYDRQTMAPILGAEEVIQIGPLVLAKKPKFGDPKDFPFKHGGEVHMAVGGLARMAKAAKAAKAEPSLPLNLPRAAPKTKEEIRPVAQRMAQQMTGEFVRPDPKKSINPAGKSLKQFQMERELSHDIRPTEGRTLMPQEVADIEKQLGMLKIGVSGDTTIADKTLYRAGPYELDLPSPQHGGPLYGLGGEGAWASNNPVAATFQKRVQELSQANKDAPVLGQFLAMGPQGSNFALHFADANLRAIDLSKMNKRQIEQFNKLISEGTEKSGPRPGFPGIEDKESAYLHFAFDPELRKRFNELMQLPKYTEKLGLPDGRVILHAITEPELRNTEVLTSGLSQMRLDPSVNPADLLMSAHPTYSHVIPKVPESTISRTRYPVPAELEFPDVAEFIKKEYRPRDATRVYQTATPRQMVDPQHIDEMKMYEELMKEYTGKKAGGAVNDGLIKVQKKRKAKA